VKDKISEGELQKRENLLYVGLDLHKQTHTAVLVNCWNEKLAVIVIENKPSAFKKLTDKVNKKANQSGLHPIYGLENACGYGRSLVLFRALFDADFVEFDEGDFCSYLMVCHLCLEVKASLKRLKALTSKHR